MQTEEKQSQELGGQKGEPGRCVLGSASYRHPDIGAKGNLPS